MSAMTRKLKEALHPYYTDQEIEKATQYYIASKCQNIAPSKEDEPGRTHAFATKQLLIPFFTKHAFRSNGKKETDKFYIILADSGMGKTTFMINLYLNFMKEQKDYIIRLFPLGYPNVLDDITRIPEEEQKRTILLLDAFDEDNEAIKDYRNRLRDILDKVGKFREVVLTCRTQFFPSEEEEPKETGIISINDRGKEFVFRKLYLSPFDDKDIKKYLDKKYSFFQFAKKKKATQIVRQSPSLMVRPMLLSYIDDLLQSNRRYKYTYQIYEELIDKWIDREVNRRSAGKEAYKQDLYKFSKTVAIDIYLKRRERNGFIIHPHEIKPLSDTHGITLNDLELKSRSLLNRNAKGQYKFSHKSILEYFLALEAFNNVEFEKQMDFDNMEQAALFLDEMYFEEAKTLKGKFKISKNDDSRDLNEIEARELKKVRYISLKKITDQDLKVLRGFRNLERLQIGNIQLAGERLKRLLTDNDLNLSRKYLMDVLAIEDLSSLKHIDLSHNQLTDTKAFKKMVNLETLNLNANKLTETSSLIYLTRLKTLDLSENRLTNINSLSMIKNIESLDLSNNQITDLSPLHHLTQLKVLNLSGNKVRNISALESLTNLSVLNLSNNEIDLEQIQVLRAFLNSCDIKY